MICRNDTLSNQGIGGGSKVAEWSKSPLKKENKHKPKESNPGPLGPEATVYTTST